MDRDLPLHEQPPGEAQPASPLGISRATACAPICESVIDFADRRCAACQCGVAPICQKRGRYPGSFWADEAPGRPGEAAWRGGYVTDSDSGGVATRITSSAGGILCHHLP